MPCAAARTLFERRLDRGVVPPGPQRPHPIGLAALQLGIDREDLGLALVGVGVACSRPTMTFSSASTLVAHSNAARSISSCM